MTPEMATYVRYLFAPFSIRQYSHVLSLVHKTYQHNLFPRLLDRFMR